MCKIYAKAIFADNEGLLFYEELLKKIRNNINNKYFIAMEIGPSIKDRINIIAKKNILYDIRVILYLNPSTISTTTAAINKFIKMNVNKEFNLTDTPLPIEILVFNTFFSLLYQCTLLYY